MESPTTLVNLSNHASDTWSGKQRAAALLLGRETLDFPFPDIRPDLDIGEVKAISARTVSAVIALRPSAVLVQGEFTLTYCLIRAFLSLSVPCYASCGPRISQERNYANGSAIRTSHFEFVQFRRYEE